MAKNFDGRKQTRQSENIVRIHTRKVTEPHVGTKLTHPALHQPRHVRRERLERLFEQRRRENRIRGIVRDVTDPRYHRNHADGHKVAQA